jgi:hypothetical protein
MACQSIAAGLLLPGCLQVRFVVDKVVLNLGGFAFALLITTIVPRL